jgi:hypothetical protein
VIACTAGGFCSKGFAPVSAGLSAFVPGTREAAVAYAERQGFEYEVRESSARKKVHIAAAEPLRQPMLPWPIALRDSELKRLPVPEIGATATAAELVA